MTEDDKKQSTVDALRITDILCGYMNSDRHCVEDGFNHFEGLSEEDFSERFINAWLRVAVHLCFLARINKCSLEDLNMGLQKAVDMSEILYNGVRAKSDNGSEEKHN